MTLTALWISELVFKDAQFKGRAHHLYCVTVLHVFRAAIGHWAIILWYRDSGMFSLGTGVGVWGVWLKQSDKNHSDLTGSFLSKYIYFYFGYHSCGWESFWNFAWLCANDYFFFSRLPPFNSSSNRFNDVKHIMAVCINCLMLLQVPLCFYLIRMCWLFT